MTNITDEGDRSGLTETSLVTSHDRGAKDWAKRRGEASGAAPEQQSNGQTVDEVIADVDAGKLTAQAALDAERQGKNRSTLIAALESRGELMGCNCGKKRKYEVTTKAGEKHVVDTLTAAMGIIRKEGGRYQAVKV